MKNIHIAILPVAILFFTAGAVQSQAPFSDTTITSLQALVTSNKTLIDTQQKTLDGLDTLNQTAQQLKLFISRG